MNTLSPLFPFLSCHICNTRQCMFPEDSFNWRVSSLMQMGCRYSHKMILSYKHSAQKTSKKSSPSSTLYRDILPNNGGLYTNVQYVKEMKHWDIINTSICVNQQTSISLKNSNGKNECCREFELLAIIHRDYQLWIVVLFLAMFFLQLNILSTVTTCLS